METIPHQMDQEFGLHIYQNTARIFDQYSLIIGKLPPGTLSVDDPSRAISRVYRKELGKNRKQIEYNADMACVTFLIRNYRDKITSSEELRDLGRQVANLAQAELENGEELATADRSAVLEISQSTVKQAGEAAGPVSDPAASTDRKIDDWIVEQINRNPDN